MRVDQCELTNHKCPLGGYVGQMKSLAGGLEASGISQPSVTERHSPMSRLASA
jgi:hypothetical protein